MQQYTEVMKARMIKRLSGPHPITTTALAEETGIPQPALSRWLREAGTVRPVGKSKTRPKAKAGSNTTQSNGSSLTPKRTQDWTPQQKLQLVLEAAALSELELGAMLRREGLHREQLDKWRQQVTEGATTALENGSRLQATQTEHRPDARAKADPRNRSYGGVGAWGGRSPRLPDSEAGDPSGDPVRGGAISLGDPTATNCSTRTGQAWLPGSYATDPVQRFEAPNHPGFSGRIRT